MDQAQKVTNQKLKKMKNHLKKMYSQAKRDVGREWYKYMESIKPKADELLKAYEDAKLTGDKDLIKKTGKEYGQFLREKTYMNEKYKSMLDTTTTKLANVNEIALSYLNNEMPSVYAINYNQLSEDMPAGISFDIVDENTVKNLVKDNPKLLPNKKLDIPKDKRWNQKAINAQVLQGIIQGESIPEMAKRLTPIMDRNKTSAIRNARTMTTSAQNKGRLDSYKTAQDNGVVLHKIWMATNSERTRAWHAALNGVEVDIDEPFENDYGEIMFPGDPDADPGNVYNCRCTMTTKIIGFMREDGSIKYIDGEESTFVDESILMSIKNRLDFDDFDFETLVKAKDEAGFEGNNWNFFQKYKNGDIDSKALDEVLLNSNKTVQTEIHKTVQGKDISNTWTRRSDKFDFAIDDILNAQGFDGLPQVVTSNEFDKLAKESNFIMQRIYSAPSQEVLDEYRNQLYNGKWYVDCSTGGAAYGEGMYTFSTNSTTVTKDIKNNINAFKSQPHRTGNKFDNVETMTFTKDAKIISTDDLLAEFEDEVEKYAKKNGIDYFDAEDIFAEKFYNRHDESGYVIDLGAYGSAKGYDAITSHDVTVVLNRTKLIIKGE